MVGRGKGPKGFEAGNSGPRDRSLRRRLFAAALQLFLQLRQDIARRFLSTRQKGNV